MKSLHPICAAVRLAVIYLTGVGRKIGPPFPYLAHISRVNPRAICGDGVSDGGSGGGTNLNNFGGGVAGHVRPSVMVVVKKSGGYGVLVRRK